MPDDYGLIAVPRRFVPEWLWWWACHPIPFWPNEVYPIQVATTRAGRKLLTKPVVPHG